MVNKARYTEYTSKQLIMAYVSREAFDPMGFFFLTRRSNAVGSVIAWADAAGQPCIELLSAIPGINRKAIECDVKLCVGG